MLGGGRRGLGGRWVARTIETELLGKSRVCASDTTSSGELKARFTSDPDVRQWVPSSLIHSKSLITHPVNLAHTRSHPLHVHNTQHLWYESDKCTSFPNWVKARTASPAPAGVHKWCQGIKQPG